MQNNIHFHGGFEPSLRITARQVRRVMRRLEALIHADLNEPVSVAECIALGAWRRLNAGDRSFSAQMWELVEEVIENQPGNEPPGPSQYVRKLDDEEARDLFQRSVSLHARLATGHFRYIEDRQNVHALLISEGLLGLLEYGRRYFTGAPMLGYIDTVGQ